MTASASLHPPTTATTTPPIAPRDQAQEAQRVVWAFTAAAGVTGAFPVPAASLAIVAENAALVTAIARLHGTTVSIGTVAANFGVVQGINVIGRTVFVETMRFVGWGTMGLGIPLASVFGATTAAVQTWVVGQLAIAIACNDGLPLDPEEARRVIADAFRQAPSLDELRSFRSENADHVEQAEAQRRRSRR